VTVTPQVVLVLELDTSLGWAISTDGGAITSGMLSLKPSRWDGGGMRYLRFRRWLEEVVASAGGFERIAYEEVRRHLGVDAAHVYGGLMATLTAWAEHRGIPYEAIPVGTWKRLLTGKGNADKASVLAAVRALGHVVETEDQADAVGILLAAVRSP
jgi:Holliday junction resolvasome RuvABC endonuclease subunit